MVRAVAVLACAVGAATLLAALLGARPSTTPASTSLAALEASWSIAASEFLRFSSVLEMLDAKGVDYDSDAVYGYVPRRLDLTVRNADAVLEGSIGEAAAGGYAAFSLSFGSSAGYVVVVDYASGNLTAVAPTYGAVMAARGAGDAVVSTNTYGPRGLKMYNASTLLVALGADANKGPRALYDWRSDSWEILCGGDSNDAHDLQMSYDYAGVWQADGRTSTKKWDASTGEVEASFAETDVADPNHVQVTDEDNIAYISSRQTDGLVKVKTDGTVLWTLGGPNGDFAVEDGKPGENITTYAAGASVWVGQHNAEYVGDDEYCLFDNRESTGENSRLLCVVLYEHKGYATISFLKDLGAYTPHFGDNDRLPTGNQLGVHWPENVDVDDQYDVRLLEVVRGSLDVAYELKVVGIACATTKACEKGLTDRWTSYSAERFYGAPLVWNASCTGGMLDFTAVDAFKRANKYRATYEVTERPTKRSDSVAGDFYFAAYWRETAVASVDVSSLVGPLLLTVTNEFGDATSVDVDTCT